MRRTSLNVGTLSLALLPVTAFALPIAPCDPLQFGCGSGPANYVERFLTGGGNGGIALFMLQLAAALAVLFIVWAGVQLIFSMGDEGKVTQHKWAMAYALIGLVVAILGQFLVSAIASTNFGQGTGRTLPLTFVASAVLFLRTILNATFVIMTVVAGLRMVYAQGKTEDYEKGKTMMKWAIGGAVMVNLASALVNAVTGYFGI